MLDPPARHDREMFFNETFSRRGLLARSAATLAVPAAVRANQSPRANPLLNISGAPNLVQAFTENASANLERSGSRWQAQNIEVGVLPQANGSFVTLLSPKSPVLRIHLRWQVEVPANLQYLGDAWERSYGDLAWRGMEPERIMPWYFLAFDGSSTVACGVKTGASALCFWQVDPAGLSLWLDVRNGGRGVKLGTHQIHVASTVVEFYPETKPFTAAKQFCRRLSPTCLLPEKPVYGGNNWYYAYGKELRRGHSRRFGTHCRICRIQ